MRKKLLTLVLVSFAWLSQLFAYDMEAIKQLADIQNNNGADVSQAQDKLNVADKNKPNTEVKSHDDKFQALAFSNSSNSNSDGEDEVSLNQKQSFGGINQPKEPVFGAQLFNQQCQNLKQTHFFNPNYQLSFGDKIAFQAWGAIDLNTVLIVDNQGNIFIPEVGPIHVEGIENKKLNDVIVENIKKVFKKGIHIYANLISAQPVQIYVSGFVNAPGLYDGLSSDSVIYYLCRAGGISQNEGSFRDIEILRQGKKLIRLDLYDFLLNGQVKAFQLQQGDTILVSALKNTLLVNGNVKKPYQYEFIKPYLSFNELFNYSKPLADTTYVRLVKNQKGKQILSYLPIERIKNQRLFAGDAITFVADKNINQVAVTIDGAISGKHQYMVKGGTTLEELIKKIQFKNEANIDNLQLYRQSVAKEQKAAIDSSLSRLERQMLTHGAVTEDGAKMQVLQSQMVMKFINDAKKVRLKGQVILGDKSTWHEMILENNDMIHVPEKSNVVTVSGEVLNSMSIEVSPKYSIENYINAAGGYSFAADKEKALLIHQNGRVNIVNPKSRTPKVTGGEQIIILSKPQTENWQVTESVSKIMYQIAVAARVALAL